MNERKYLTQHEINEFHSLFEQHCIKKGYSPNQALAFLSITFLGTFEMHGYSEEFLDKTLKRMKEKFLLKRAERDISQ